MSVIGFTTLTTIGLMAAMLAAGVLLGSIFFGGLWWTVSRGLTAANPALWFGLSALGRMGLLAAGIYYISRAGWVSVLLCLCGVLIARAAVTRLTRGRRPAVQLRPGRDSTPGYEPPCT